jgi:MraZ protein
VPSPLRAILAEKGGSLEIVGRRSEHGPCIEIWPKPVFHAMVERRVADLDPFSAEYDSIAERLVAEAHALSIDGEGRVVLPRDLVDHAGLAGEIAYTGRVSHFQIWDRARLKETRAARTTGGGGAAA